MSTTNSEPQMGSAGLDLPRLIERHRPVVVLGAAIVPLVVSAVLSAFRHDLTAATDVLVLVLVVIAAASTGVRVAGIVAAISGGVWFDFLLSAPYGRLTINDPDNVEAAVLLVVIGIAVSEVALWGRRQQARADRRAGYLDGVLGTAEIVTLSTESPEALTAHVAEQIKQVMGVSRCRFVLGPVHDARIPVLGHQGDLTRNGKDVDVDRDGLPIDDSVALVVTRSGTTVGHFLLTSAAHIARPTLEQRKVAILLADQVGQVLGDRA